MSAMIGLGVHRGWVSFMASSRRLTRSFLSIVRGKGLWVVEGNAPLKLDIQYMTYIYFAAACSYGVHCVAFTVFALGEIDGDFGFS
jgi:hypothetical protein